VLRFSASFNSGTRISFDIDFDAIEDVADTAGVGTSVIEKNVDLQVVFENENGETVTRDGLSALGSGKVSNGENAFAFDSGTARITIDERQILGASAVFVERQLGLRHGRSGVHVGDLHRHRVRRRDALPDGVWHQLQLHHEQLRHVQRDRRCTTVSVAATASTFSLANAGENSAATYTIGINATELKLLATRTKLRPVKSTARKLPAASPLRHQRQRGHGFADNTVSNVSFTISGSADNATITLSDGVGGTATRPASTWPAVHEHDLHHRWRRERRRDHRPRTTASAGGTHGGRDGELQGPWRVHG
jgi:hypothetical protein